MSDLETIVETPAPDLATSAFTWNTLRAISKTEFVPSALRNKPEAILACILTGRELGMGPMESLRTIDMIDGKPSPSSEWMVGKVLDAGHVLVADEQTSETCTVTGIRFRDGTEQARMSFTFTMDMAKRANLAGKSNWKNYPEAMLYWRAVAQLCRQFFPDVLRGLRYLPDELGVEWEPTEPNLAEAVDGAGQVVQRFDIDTGEVVDEPVIEGQETLYTDDDPERPF